MMTFDRFFHILKKPYLIALWALLIGGVYFFADQPLALFCHSLVLGHSEILFQGISLLGKWTLYLAAFFLLGLWFHFGSKNRLFEARAWYLLGCVLLPNLINLALKIILGRARPELLFTQQLYGFYFFQMDPLYWSFPSGHAVTTAALASGLWFLWPRYRALYLALVLFVVSSRVILCRHYLSDVLCGVYYSALLVGLWTKLWLKKGMSVTRP